VLALAPAKLAVPRPTVPQAATDGVRCRGDAVRALSLWASAKLAKAQSRHNAIELSFFITSYLSIYKQLRRWISPVLSEL
jgi:hypothetical protein